MSLADKIKQVKNKIKPVENEIFIVLIIIFSSFIIFGLVKLYEIRKEKTPITIENISQNNSGENASAGEGSAEKLFVASKNGAKYYFPWCSGVSKIKEENKVWFTTKEQAQKAGLTPAANCKGL
jgi:hypothetical protein